jgi:hypothetical protein
VISVLRDELLAAALDHATRGWRVFPLRPSDKRPAIRDWEPRATTDTARIRRAWESGPFNIGIACGPSGLVVIDLDTPKPGALPPPEWDQPGISDGADVLAALAESAQVRPPFDTFSVRTASGGEHLYFTAPPDVQIRNSAGRLGWLIDIRARGGYVVAAGSVIGGRQYVAPDVVPIGSLPSWIATALAPANPTPAAPDFRALVDVVGRRSRYAGAALRGELENVLNTRPESRQRNDILNRAAFALGQLVGSGLLPDGLAVAALAEASAAIGLPAGEAHATIRSGLTAGARTPRRTTTEEKA